MYVHSKLSPTRVVFSGTHKVVYSVTFERPVSYSAVVGV